MIQDNIDKNEWCDNCGEHRTVLLDGTDGDKICPRCIMNEAAYHQDEVRHHRERITRRYERGRWREQ